VAVWSKLLSLATMGREHFAGGTEFSVAAARGRHFQYGHDFELGPSPNLGDFDRHAAVRHEPWGCGYSGSGGAGLDQTKGNLRFRSPSA